jgi:hypothetical protein
MGTVCQVSNPNFINFLHIVLAVMERSTKDDVAFGSLCDTPRISMRCALCTSRSRMPSASVGSSGAQAMAKSEPSSTSGSDPRRSPRSFKFCRSGSYIAVMSSACARFRSRNSGAARGRLSECQRHNSYPDRWDPLWKMLRGIMITVPGITIN